MLNEEKTIAKEQIIEPEVKTKDVKATAPKLLFGMPAKSLILIATLTVITLILLITAVITLPHSKTLKATTPVKKPIIKVNRQTMLTFSSPVIATGSAYNTADIQITTGVNKIVAVQLDLSFDPTVIQDVSITPGSFFADPVILFKKIDPVKGTISFAFGIGLSQQPATGPGTLATVSFTPVPGQIKPTNITFLPTTVIAAQGEVISVLKSSTGLTLTTK